MGKMTHLSLLVFLTTCIVTYGKHRLCYNEYPELSGLLCYKRCRSGYSGAGPVCWGRCPSRTTDIGAVCTKHTRVRGVGKTLRFCRRGEQKNGLLCYPKCKSGYGGAGPLCWKNCNSGYRDDGMSCRRDVHAKGRWVGNCPWYDKCGLCGGPWYNVCGRRRKCGGSCPSGYRNDGCTCWRDAHIYFKKSYGRGVGKPMVCGSNEDQSGALCYPKCPWGFYGVGPVCWSKCSGKTIDTGMQCQKKSYGRGVGRVINCLKTPTCDDIKDCQGLISVFRNLGNIKSFQGAACQALYSKVRPWVNILKSFNSCYKNSQWGTLSVSLALGLAAGNSVSGEIGIAIDVDRNEGICFIGACTGFKADLSFGGELIIGWWKSKDSIPGKSTVINAGVDIPGTELGIGVSWVLSDKGDYIGTTFGIGLGVGLNPIDLGAYTCNTPQSSVKQFTP